MMALLYVTLALVAAGILESVWHRRNLRRIPVRIHVNGTRGKSSVTRLIAAGLREGDRTVVAKTTGTLARVILPNAREMAVFRPAGANVLEQKRIVALAAANGADVLVIECMALQPTLQWLCEHRFIRATHGVITNARADHLEVMGPGEEDVALALAGMVPRGGKLFTAERDHVDAFAMAARDRRTELVPTTAEDVAAISEEDMAGFSYLEHEENVALALRVCEDVGVERERALRGMWKCRPDPGAMTEHRIDFFGRRIVFVNGFAANDPESTERIWRMAIERHPGIHRRVAVFNCRADRPERSIQLARAYAAWPAANTLVLIGSGTYLFSRAAVKAGVGPEVFVYADNARVEEIFELIVEASGREALVMGMGNIGGPGFTLARFFRNRETLEDGTP